MTFEQWWSNHAIQESDILPILKLSFKELAKSAWESALYNEASRFIAWEKNRDKTESPKGAGGEK